MPFQFTPARRHLYEDGMIYLGRDEYNREIGIHLERHIIEIAGARSGKGACHLIPNLLRWPHNAIVVDPKGENVEATWRARLEMGQQVYVLDPFDVANVPPNLKASCNLLAGITSESPTAREDLRVIADGVVMRHKAEDATWDNGAVSVLSGFMAYVCATHPPEERDLTAVRRLLCLPPDALREAFLEMANTDGFGNLCKAAAAIGLSESKKNREFVGGAVDHTEWLDSPSMKAVLTGENDLDLSILKEGNATVYLVLPPHYLGEHARFLRVFVRAALDAMAKRLTGKKCLFMLDEFFALGHIEQISKAAGLMPGYGVHLWPFMQDLGQLRKLYGEEGATGFFANADANIFFGNGDAFTLEFISRVLGRKTADDIGVPPPRIDEHDAMAAVRSFAHGQIVPPRPVTPIPSKKNPVASHMGAGLLNMVNHAFYEAAVNEKNVAGAQVAAYDRILSARDQNALREYHHAMSARGEPRLFPDEIKQMIGKHRGEVVARSMIVFLGHGEVLNIRLAPYFMPKPAEIIPSEEIKFLGNINENRALVIKAGKEMAAWSTKWEEINLTKEGLKDLAKCLPIAFVFVVISALTSQRMMGDKEIMTFWFFLTLIMWVSALIMNHLDKKKKLKQVVVWGLKLRYAYWELLSSGDDLPEETAENLTPIGANWARRVRTSFIEHAEKNGLMIALKPTEGKIFEKAGITQVT